MDETLVSDSLLPKCFKFTESDQIFTWACSDNPQRTTLCSTYVKFFEMLQR